MVKQKYRGWIHKDRSVHFDSLCKFRKCCTASLDRTSPESRSLQTSVAFGLTLLSLAHRSVRDEPGGHQGCRCLDRFEANLLPGDAIDRQLGLVNANGVVVALCALVHLVLEVLDEAILGAQDLLELLRDTRNHSWIQLRCLKDFRELSLFFMELSSAEIQFLLKNDVLELSLALNFPDTLLETTIQVVTLFLRLQELLLQRTILLFSILHFLFQLCATCTKVLERHLVFGTVFQILLELSSCFLLLCQRLREVLVLNGKLMHLLLVRLFLRPHLSNFILQGTDEAEIVMGDVVVVALDKIEGLLMIHEEIVDVLIL